MKCRNCGKEIPPTAKFCENCGTPVGDGTGRTATVPPHTPGVSSRQIPRTSAPQSITRNITLYPDGKYRWHFESSPLGRMKALLHIWSGAVCLGLLGFLVFEGIGIFNHTFTWEGCMADLRTGGIILAAFLGVSTIGFLAYTFLRGHENLVYEMDARTLSQVFGHTRPSPGSDTPPTDRKRRKSIDFDDIRSVKSVPAKHLLELRRPLWRRMDVYAQEQDYDFLVNYLRTHVRKRCTFL